MHGGHEEHPIEDDHVSDEQRHPWSDEIAALKDRLAASEKQRMLAEERLRLATADVEQREAAIATRNKKSLQRECAARALDEVVAARRAELGVLATAEYSPLRQEASRPTRRWWHVPLTITAAVMAVVMVVQHQRARSLESEVATLESALSAAAAALVEARHDIERTRDDAAFVARDAASEAVGTAPAVADAPVAPGNRPVKPRKTKKEIATCENNGDPLACIPDDRHRP